MEFINQQSGMNTNNNLRQVPMNNQNMQQLIEKNQQKPDTSSKEESLGNMKINKNSTDGQKLSRDSSGIIGTNFNQFGEDMENISNNRKDSKNIAGREPSSNCSNLESKSNASLTKKEENRDNKEFSSDKQIVTHGISPIETGILTPPNMAKKNLLMNENHNSVNINELENNAENSSNVHSDEPEQKQISSKSLPFNNIPQNMQNNMSSSNPVAVQQHQLNQNNIQLNAVNNPNSNPYNMYNYNIMKINQYPQNNNQMIDIEQQNKMYNNMNYGNLNPQNNATANHNNFSLNASNSDTLTEEELLQRQIDDLVSEIKLTDKAIEDENSEILNLQVQIENVSSEYQVLSSAKKEQESVDDPAIEYIDKTCADDNACFKTLNVKSFDEITINSFSSILQEEILIFQKYLDTSVAERQLKCNNLFEVIQEKCAKSLPDLTLCITGSLFTNLLMPWSDLNILVTVNPTYKQKPYPNDDILEIILATMKTIPGLIRDYKHVKTQFYGLLKVTAAENYDFLRFEIVFKEVKMIRNEPIIIQYLEKYECLKPLYMVVRVF